MNAILKRTRGDGVQGEHAFVDQFCAHLTIQPRMESEIVIILKRSTADQ